MGREGGTNGDGSSETLHLSKRLTGGRERRIQICRVANEVVVPDSSVPTRVMSPTKTEQDTGALAAPSKCAERCICSIG